MSTKVIAGIVIGVVVVIIGGYFALSANKENQINPNSDLQGDITNEKTIETQGKKMAFSDFVKNGGSYKCEVKQAMSDFYNSGTVYMNGSNIRTDFSTIAEGRTIESSFIMKDGYMYNWSSASANMGFKQKIDKDNSSTDESDIYSWNADQIGDYNCEAWSPDNSKFEIPKSVTFTVIGA